MAEAFYIPLTGKLDSKEEEYFQWWLDDLVAAGYVGDIVYQPESYVTVEKQTYRTTKVLKTKSKSVEKTLSQQRVYTPDFKVYWTDKARHIFYRKLGESSPESGVPFWAQEDEDGIYSVFEVKPQFDSNNMTRLAAINIDIVYAKYGVRVEMVKVGNKKSSVFDKTFTPSRYFQTDKTPKDRKIHFPTATLSDYILSREEEVKKVMDLLVSQ